MTDNSKPTEKQQLSGGTFRPNALGVACPKETAPVRDSQMVAIPAFPPYLGAKPK